MIFNTILIPGHQWWLPALILLAVAAVVLARTYLSSPAGASVRAVCALLKLLGLAALAACLLNPLWSGERARPGANYFAIVADDSQSMGIKDRGETRTRGQMLTNLLVAFRAKWINKLEDNFQVRRYTFDSRLQSTRDFSELDFNGHASSLGAALGTIADRYRGQPLAGILLFTDGNATDLTDGTVHVDGLPPVYPVVMGSDNTVNDVAIQNIAVSQTAFEDAPVTVQAGVTAGGYAGREIVAQLLDQTGKPVQEQTQRPGGGNEAMKFRFELRPEKAGISFYRLRASARDEMGQFERPETSLEATLANNTRTFVVDRGRGPYRILYVSGRPNWDYKFMERALQEDDQVQLSALIRIAKREPKFDFRGRIGEFSNPLFRGFGATNEETARYDQPVMKWLLPANSETNLFVAGFPKSADVLYRFDAVIVGDLESEFFTRDQMTLLQKFVSERGGGFLMLGGAESFHEGDYDHTPIGEMLPVYVDSIGEPKQLDNLHWHLTKEGMLQPWMRLRDTEAGEKARLAEMPGFEVLNHVRDVKPGASVLAEVQDDAGETFPALATQRFGNGRVGALMIGDMWLWGMRDEAMHKDMDKAWRQLVRWLIADVPRRIEFHAEPLAGDPNGAMSLQVRARDKEFHPLDNATVNITVTPADRVATPGASAVGAETNNVHFTAEPASSETGLYEADYVPRATGGYRAEAVVMDGNGVEVGRAETGWASDPSAEEFKSLKPNRALLESIARQTGGEVITTDQLNAFAAGLPNRKAPVTEIWTSPIWHKPLVFLFALGCFVAEWGLRRWKGLA